MRMARVLPLDVTKEIRALLPTWLACMTAVATAAIFREGAVETSMVHGTIFRAVETSMAHGLPRVSPTSSVRSRWVRCRSAMSTAIARCRCSSRCL